MADFGLGEDVYTTGYFRQSKDDPIKLPFKWMSPESIEDGVFSEKSDVVTGLTINHSRIECAHIW